MSDRSIQEAVQQLAGTKFSDNVTFITASVNSYDAPSRSCNCTPIQGTSQTDIIAYLMAETDDGMLIVPSIGSTVVICYSPKNLPYIVLFSQIQKFTFVSENGIQFQGGEYGGLVIGSVLLTALNALQSYAGQPLTTEIELINSSVTHGS